MQNENSVCFVGKIEEINSIEGADKIVQAIISNWECVIQKDQFSVGNLVVIAVTDAVIPIELADKLGITKYLKNRKRTGEYTVKTTKLKGVYSTATIVGTAYDFVKVLSEGTDMMDYYKIKKYEEPVTTMQLSSGKKVRYQKNPNFHVYHKFPNAKNAPNIFSANDEIIISRKVHGCNARYGIVKKSKVTFIDKIKKFLFKYIQHMPLKWKFAEYDYVYGSHEVEKGSTSQGFYSTDVWGEVAKKYEIQDKLWEYVNIYGTKEGIIIYGEIYGPGIQKYYDYNEKEIKFQAFDIKLGGEYVSTDLFNLTMALMLLPTVDIYYRGVYNEEKIKEYQFGRFIPNTKVPEEGVVVKSVTGDRAKIAKYINPAYLEFQSKKEDSTDFH